MVGQVDDTTLIPQPVSWSSTKTDRIPDYFTPEACMMVHDRWSTGSMRHIARVKEHIHDVVESSVFESFYVNSFWPSDIFLDKSVYHSTIILIMNFVPN